MKNLVPIALSMLIFFAGSANAQTADASHSRVVAPAGMEQRGKIDQDCEQVGSDLWECWSCEEDDASKETICDTWLSDDNGGWDFKRQPPVSISRSQP